MISRKRFYLSEEFRRSLEKYIGTYVVHQIPPHDLYCFLEKYIGSSEEFQTNPPGSAIVFTSDFPKPQISLSVAVSTILAIAKHPGEYTEKDLRNKFHERPASNPSKNKSAISTFLRFLIEKNILEIR